MLTGVCWVDYQQYREDKSIKTFISFRCLTLKDSIGNGGIFCRINQGVFAASPHLGIEFYSSTYKT